jgi:hypothetical protein
VLPWVLESAVEELLEGQQPIPTSFPGCLRVEEAAALLCVKYCLIGGGSAVTSVWPSETCTIFREVEGLAPGGLDLDATSLGRLCLEPTVFSSIAIATSANMGSIPGSPWGSSLLDFFSTAAVSAGGLEHSEGGGIV